MDRQTAAVERRPRSFDRRGGTGIAVLIVLLALAVSCVVPAMAAGEEYACTGEWTEDLSGPRGVAVNAAGEVYVANSVAGTISRFSSTGTLINTLGRPGTGPGQFTTPSGVALDAAGNVYVTDYVNKRVLKLAPDGTLLQQFGSAGNGDGQFMSPRDVDLDSKGNVYVADVLLNRVVKFGPSGTFVRIWGRSDGAAGSGPGEFRQPYGVALDDADNLYVTDNYNPRVQKFGQDGEFVLSWGGVSGTGDGEFRSPVGVATDSAGNVYVVESTGSRVQKFSSSGALLTKWGSSITGPGQFSNPQGIAVDAAGRVYVTQSNSDKVQVFTAVPPLIARFDPEATTGPAPLVIRFTDTSTGSPTGWAWDFGDGASDMVRNPEHTYTAAGEYTVTLTVTDGRGRTASATQTVHVTPGNTVPVALAQSVTTDEDTQKAVSLAGSDADGDILTFNVASGPEHGTLSGAAPELTYTPAGDFNGVDSFIFTTNDGTAGSAPATVTIAVIAANDAPVAAGDTYVLCEDDVLTVPAPGVAGNDLDIDGDALAARLDDPPAHGELAFNPDGSFTYTPAGDFSGADSFAYSVTDGTERSGPATVSIEVAGIDDPPVAADDGYTTDEDMSLVVAAPGVLDNDADVDGDALTVSVIDDAAHGTLALDPDGSFTYTPDPDFAGTDSFRYRLEGAAAPATVTITVNGVNDAPTISPSLTVPLDPRPVGTTVSVSATFTDPDPGDHHTATWTWGDGGTSPGTVGAGTVSGSHVYAAPGVYTVGLALSDGTAGATATATQYTVVYDPDGGFVTGGGWIASPAGAYAADPALTGKATFGFVSKYRKGQAVPTGETQFQFRAAGLDFESSSYDWLVIAGAKAQYRGVGTIDGAGSYGFMLTAIDGSRGAGTDTFRIRIWDRTANDAVVYDNMVGAPDTADPTTALGGGSIVVHRG